MEHPDATSCLVPVTPDPRQGTPPTTEGVPADLTNLALAAGLMLTAFLVFWMGLYLGNHIAVLALIASFGTFSLVWVLHRLRVFYRPHGALIAIGAVALFAAAVPFIGRAFQSLDHAAKKRLAGESAMDERGIVSAPPVPTRENAPEAPATPPAPAPAPPEEDVIRELLAPAPDPSAGRLIRVVQDAKVLIAGRKYLIRAGSEFPLREFKDGTVTFQAGSQEVTISSDMVKFTGKSKETPQEITKLAEAESMRRYPALGVRNSDENQLYLSRVNDLKLEMPELLKDPHWPLLIAEQLATQEGWKRSDLPSDDNVPPAPTGPDAPEMARPPAPPDLSEPPVPSLPSEVPQEAPPSPR